jgi:hypothetical protein
MVDLAVTLQSQIDRGAAVILAHQLYGLCRGE